MNREIKFRGRRVTDKVEVVGWYYEDSCKFPFIITNEDEAYIFHAVIPETVGQYTGRKDKNGKEIYEGDVFGNTPQLRCVVKIESDGAYKLHFFDERIRSISILNHKISKSEIIGNIHQTPNLFEETRAKIKPCPFCGIIKIDFKDHPETCFLYRIWKQSKTNCMSIVKKL